MQEFREKFDCLVETLEQKHFETDAVQIERLLDSAFDLFRSSEAANIDDPAACLIGLSDALQKTYQK